MYYALQLMDYTSLLIATTYIHPTLLIPRSAPIYLLMLLHFQAWLKEMAFLFPLTSLTLYFFSFSLPQPDTQTSGTFPLSSAKRSKDVNEAANETIPPTSEELQFTEEGLKQMKKKVSF